MLIIVLWLVSVLFKAGRFEGHQILIDKGQYYDCCEGWYDDEGNVFNIEKLVFTKEDVGKEKVVHYQIPDAQVYAQHIYRIHQTIPPTHVVHR